MTCNSSYPTITFQVNLALASTEVNGPNGSPLSTTVLPPDRYSGVLEQDGVAASLAFRATLRELYLPGVTAGDNRIVHHGDTFTETGDNAVYLRNTYGIGYATDPNNQFLTILSSN